MAHKICAHSRPLQKLQQQIVFSGYDCGMIVSSIHAQTQVIAAQVSPKEGDVVNDMNVVNVVEAARCVQWVQMLEEAMREMEAQGPMEMEPDQEFLQIINQDPQLLLALNELDASLFEAIDEGSEAALRSALSNGANINAHDSEGRTPAMMAILRGQRHCLGILMDQGINHSATDSRGRTVFDYFPKFGSLSQERLAKSSSVLSALSIEAALTNVLSPA
jgi:Ankyrin repeats (many copies)